jgi:DNA ligase-1
MPTPFRALAELGDKLESTTKRLLMIDTVAAFLADLEADEIELAVSMILGRPLPRSDPRSLDVSWATLSEVIRRITSIDWKLFREAFGETGDIGAATKTVFERNRVRKQMALFEKPLSIMEVERSFERIAETFGAGSREKKDRLIEALLSQASPLEAKYIVKIFIGEMRTGFHEGLMEQAVSKASQIPLKDVQEASMITGDVSVVASIARIEGKEGLRKIGFKVFRPVSLMLAQLADNVAEALKEHDGETALEYKYDGARVQIHKQGDAVRIFSRRLTDVTESLPEIVETAKKNIAAKEAILEGEVVAVDNQGFPIPFQHLMRRFRRVHEIAGTAEKIPLKLYLFDVLYLNGENLISRPYVQRRQELSANAGEIPLAVQIVTDDVGEAERFLKQSMDGGHEGLMAKRLDGSYAPGIRGKRWLKIKPVLDPLDLVIVAAEWGYGRRHEWLSDYYLAAKNDETGEFQTVGKTFKGLTDAEIIEMTERLKELTIRVEPRKVVVVPKIVVEVAYNEVQKSPTYECQMALRFARITRVRYDKSPEQADTIQRIRGIYESQFRKKGRYTTD